MVGDLSCICGPIGWKCLYLAGIWRPGFLWRTSEGKLRRAQQVRELPPEDWKVGRVYTERPTHVRSFQRLCFQIHLGAFRTLSALLWFKVGLSKSFHQVIIADLLYLSATEATPTTLTSCAYSSVTFFGVSTPRCLSEWTFHRQTQAVSPTVKLIWSEGLFQWWIRTHGEEEKLFHMSGITLKLPASANVSSNNSACGMFQVSIRYRVRPEVNPSQVQCPSTYLSVHQQFLDLKKLFNWLHNEHEKIWMISANRLDVLCVIAKETFSLALIDTKRLRGKILSVLWQGILKRTTLIYRCKFDSSNKKQMCDFLNDWTNCCLDFLRMQIKLLKINCKNW